MLIGHLPAPLPARRLAARNHHAAQGGAATEAQVGGFLKVSLEELLIALNDDRHLLHDPDGRFAQRAPAAGADPQSLYPHGFSAQRLIEVVESQAVWDDV